MYELRIYSMEPGSFGSVVRSRQVKAPHCITSIQFSPTSEHLLIAYGRYATATLSSCGFDTTSVCMRILTTISCFTIGCSSSWLV